MAKPLHNKRFGPITLQAKFKADPDDDRSFILRPASIAPGGEYEYGRMIGLSEEEIRYRIHSGHGMPEIHAHVAWERGKWAPDGKDPLPAPQPEDIWVCFLMRTSNREVYIAMPASLVRRQTQKENDDASND